MGNNKTGETKLREQQELTAQTRARQSSGNLGWKIVGAAALALAATAVFSSLNDIRRYIRISRM
jgi:hypothetical protein